MRAAIFDLDDTLVQTNAASNATWQRLAEEFAPQVSVVEDELHAALNQARRWFWANPERHSQWRMLMAESAAEALRVVLDERGQSVDVPVLNAFAERYTTIFFESLVLFTDALEVLHELRARGTQLAMITNGGTVWQRRKIDQHALAPLFECIVVEGEFGVGKPAPETYAHALTALGVDARDTCMVGDRLDWDVLGPQKLGITGVWYDFAGRGLPEQRAGEPDRVIRTLAELTEADRG
jgi:putative hydrolase of the HAD superfamily